MTRILIVSLNYAPEETGIAPYSTGLAEHLASRGCDVTVVAGMPHYPAWRVDAAYAPRTSPRSTAAPSAVAPSAVLPSPVARAFSPRAAVAHALGPVETRNGVEVRRARHYVPATQSGLHRALYEASSLSMAVAASGTRRPDAVLGVIPSVSGGIVARVMAARFDVPYGLIFQDLAGQAATQSGIEGAPSVSIAARAAEGFAARGAAAIGIVAEGMRTYVSSRGVDAARIRRVRNWTRGAAATMRRDDARLLLGWPRDAFVCLHAGNMGAKQALENVIACARLAVNDAPQLQFVLMGDGNQRAALKAIAEGSALSNLRFMTLQPELLYASVLSAADVLLVNQRGSVSDMSLPSKLTSYFASGRPVVAAVAENSETAREVRASGGGTVCAPDQPRVLLDAIARVAGDGMLAADLGRCGEAWARDVLSEEAALRGYEDLLEVVLSEGRSEYAGRTTTNARANPRRVVGIPRTGNVGRPSPAVAPRVTPSDAGSSAQHSNDDDEERRAA